MRTLTATLTLFLATALPAQDAKPTLVTKPDTSVSTSSANLILLPVVVRDRKGELVKDLTLADFSLKAGGRTLDKSEPQPVTFFSHATDLPLTLGLIVDASASQRKSLDDEKSASQVFLTSILQPAAAKRAADQAFVVQFAKPIELLQDLTADPVRLQKAITELGTEDPNFHTTTEPDTTDSEGRRVQHTGTSLYDSLFLSADEITTKLTGRKVLIVFTDGVDVGSKNSLTDTIESIQTANTTVYAIFLRGAQRFQQPTPTDHTPRTSGSGYPGGGGGYPGGGYPGGGYPRGGGNNPNSSGGNNPNNVPGGNRKPSVDGKQVLDRICNETGGHAFEVSKHQTIDDIYKQIAEELRAQYWLGFTPTGIATRYGYHQFDLSFTKPEFAKLQIQTRDGFYGGDNK
jgi:VWFA-related protein